jgi:hypothetical protein
MRLFPRMHTSHSQACSFEGSLVCWQQNFKNDAQGVIFWQWQMWEVAYNILCWIINNTFSYIGTNSENIYRRNTLKSNQNIAWPFPEKIREITEEGYVVCLLTSLKRKILIYYASQRKFVQASRHILVFLLARLAARFKTLISTPDNHCIRIQSFIIKCSTSM